LTIGASRLKGDVTAPEALSGMRRSPEVAVHEQRSQPRVPIDLSVSCEVKDGAAFSGMARNISIGGMFIETEHQLPFGTELTIVTRLPGTKADARLPALVRWTEASGFGVQFGLLGARETHAISQLLRV
jgi:type IV pilus assembly protein PilZ